MLAEGVGVDVGDSHLARNLCAAVDEDPDEELDARRSTDEARDRALEAISEAQRAMREELAEL
jgi:hypothetical protein